MKKFPSIEQFRNTVKSVQLTHDYVGRDTNEDPIYEHISDYPVVQFTGTVKLHGTNAAIRICNGEITYQSRENVITPQKDNAGFATAMSQIPKDKLLNPK